jgi:uncharacterized membrane protein
MVQTLSEYLKESPRNGWIATSIIPLVAVVVYSIRLALIYGHLPENIPIHFGLDGTPNGWMSRPVLAIFSPLMILALILLLASTNRFRPSAQGFVLANLIFWSATGLTTGAFWGILTASVNNTRFNVYMLLVWPVLFVLGEYVVLHLYKALR